MTCIVGLKENGVVYIGADSSAYCNGIVTSSKLEKVFKVKDFIIGYTTSFRMGQLLQYYLSEVEDKEEGQGDLEYLVKTVIPFIQKLFKENGFANINENVERGGKFLLAYNNNLYEIEGDYQVNTYHDNYNSVGSGEDFAKSSFYTTRNVKISPETKVYLALESAEHFVSSVCRPFTILSDK